MAFIKKNKYNEYEEASRNLNAKEEIVDAASRIIFEKVSDDDAYAANLINKMKEGYPLVLNFADLEFSAANKLLAFFSGACYAIEGNIVKISEENYLFARKVDFLDGSLRKFLEQL